LKYNTITKVFFGIGMCAFLLSKNNFGDTVFADNYNTDGYPVYRVMEAVPIESRVKAYGENLYISINDSNAKNVSQLSQINQPAPVQTPTPNSNNVVYMDWSEVKTVFTLNKDAEVYDILSGKTYYVRSFSNGNHADVETVTKQDTKIMYETFGNSWSWDVRPVWVTINGYTIAGSINGMPHAKGVIDGNDMDGQVCIHFLNSKTHNGNASFTQLHQDIAKQAYELSLK